MGLVAKELGAATEGPCLRYGFGADTLENVALTGYSVVFLVSRVVYFLLGTP